MFGRNIIFFIDRKEGKERNIVFCLTEFPITPKIPTTKSEIPCIHNLQDELKKSLAELAAHTVVLLEELSVDERFNKETSVTISIAATAADNLPLISNTSEIKRKIN